MFHSTFGPRRRGDGSKRRVAGSQPLRFEVLETRNLLAHLVDDPAGPVGEADSGLPAEDEFAWTPRLSIAVDDFEARVLAEGGTFEVSEWYVPDSDEDDSEGLTGDAVEAALTEGEDEVVTQIEMQAFDDDDSAVVLDVDLPSGVSRTSAEGPAQAVDQAIVESLATAMELSLDSLALDAPAEPLAAELPKEIVVIDIDGLPEDRIEQLAAQSGLRRMDSDADSVRYALDQSPVDSEQAQDIIKYIADAIARRDLGSIRSLGLGAVQQAVRLLSLKEVRDTILDRLYEQPEQPVPQPPSSTGGGATSQPSTTPSQTIQPPLSGGDSTPISSARALLGRLGDAIATRRLGEVRSIGLGQIKQAVRQVTINDVREILLQRLRAADD